jgi:hypothetical protein
MDKWFPWLFGLAFVLVLTSIVYTAMLAQECAESGDPKSQACFKYWVLTQQSNNQNVNVWVNK